MWNAEEKKIIAQALTLYRSEVEKLWKKADKLGHRKAGDLKQSMLEVDAIRSKLT